MDTSEKHLKANSEATSVECEVHFLFVIHSIFFYFFAKKSEGMHVNDVYSMSMWS